MINFKSLDNYSNKSLYLYCLKNKTRLTKYKYFVAKDHYYSYLYARDIIEGRFPLGEPTIAKSNYMY
jgi:hypothetical protein